MPVADLSAPESALGTGPRGCYTVHSAEKAFADGRANPVNNFTGVTWQATRPRATLCLTL